MRSDYILSRIPSRGLSFDKFEATSGGQPRKGGALREARSAAPRSPTEPYGSYTLDFSR